LILFALGLFPSYVSIFFVEKHYTAFWTGFWNIYGLLITGVGLAMDNYDLLTILILILVIIFLVILVYRRVFAPESGYYSEVEEAEAYFFRRFGASWVTTSLNWGLYFGFTAGLFWGILAIFIHAILMLVIFNRLK
jgi:hypothetical protein